MSARGHVRASKKAAVRERCGGRCHYCDALTAPGAGTVDHVVPISLDGRDANWNLVWACAPCNQAKGDRQTCDCAFCIHAAGEHNRLDLRPEHLRPLSYTVGELMGAS